MYCDEYADYESAQQCTGAREDGRELVVGQIANEQLNTGPGGVFYGTCMSRVRGGSRIFIVVVEEPSSEDDDRMHGKIVKRKKW